MADNGEDDVASQVVPQSFDEHAQQREDDLRFPHRPRNHSPTLPFHTLYRDLFDPLIENSNKKHRAHAVNLRRVGPKAVNSQAPHERRRAIIESYISRWRREVGDDFFPAMRLILPDKDRDRAMYGLKEKVLAKYVVKILKIDKSSDDGYNLMNWKAPGLNEAAARKAGDFPGRVADVFRKRPFRTQPGNLTIEEVNEMLDRLSRAAKEEQQLPIMEEFYRQMNPDELKWLVSIILRTMHIGATEKTIFNIWHPDAEVMFNISSSLKKVCWELWNTNIRLENDEDRGLAVGECFQPQLAQFQAKKVEHYVRKMGVSEEDPEFWIEEKLDGERMQMHTWIVRQKQKENDPDEPEPPYRTFRFWSRKAKDYTYLYGEYLDGPNEKCGLTRYFKDAFAENVDSLILDGEMITWDTQREKMVAFGSLKTAALEHQKNPFSNEPQPLFRVFDILLLNGQDLIRYNLRERRKALERVIKPVPQHLELLQYQVGRTWDDIERALRKVVAEASEGLVVKNPRSRYRLNDRNDDWIKVKPEYMDSFGESLDCLVIGGYYGSGRRGGGLSSFLCGLRVDSKRGQEPSQKFLSFFKVGGGLTANDYATIRHHTEDKWIPWDPKKPPSDYIELGGGVQYQRERPDVWIKPEDSVVIQAKAASVGPSDEFAANLTLRFPRFQKLRDDKDWKSALSVQEFLDVKDTAETKVQEAKTMKAESRKRHKTTDLRRRPLQVVGYTKRAIDLVQTDRSQGTGVFHGLTFFVMTESTKPKKLKVEIEEMIKLHGGKIIQTAEPKSDNEGNPPDEVTCVAAKKTVKVASLIKRGEVVLLRPQWIFDSIDQARTDAALALPVQPLRPEMQRHVLFAPEDRRELYESEVDQYGDSFARDTTVEELRELMNNMQDVDMSCGWDDRIFDLTGESRGWLFRGTVILFVQPESAEGFAKVQFDILRQTAIFAGAALAKDLDDTRVTHVVTGGQDDKQLKAIRKELSSRQRLPRIVTTAWIEQSWKEKTRLDEERFVP